MLLHEIVVGEVAAVVQASELENNLDNLWLVLTGEAIVRLPSKDSLDALIDHLRTDRVLGCVRATIKVDMLFRQDQNCLVGPDRLLLAILVRLLDCLLDVAPHVGRVVTVEVDELLGQHWFTVHGVCSVLVGHARVAVARDGVQVVLVGLVSDDVDSLMHVNLGVLRAVLFLIVRQDAVVRDLHEIHLH